MKTTLLILGALFSLTVIAQPDKKSVVIGSMADKPNAILIVNPPNADQGVLLPQLTTAQRVSLIPSSPSENGLTVFDTNLQSYFYWSNGAWVRALSDNIIKTNFYVIDPASFQMLKSNNKADRNNIAVFETDNTFVTAVKNNDGEEMMAAANLPHGAVIKEITVYYMDNDTDNLKVTFMRKSLSGNNQNIVHWESSDKLPSVRQQSFNNFNGLDVIDLENYSYRILVVFNIDDSDTVYEPSDAKQRIYGVKIKYQQ
jgi:hypothetical protein